MNSRASCSVSWPAAAESITAAPSRDQVQVDLDRPARPRHDPFQAKLQRELVAFLGEVDRLAHDDFALVAK
jgi:hypothetical protein